MKLTVHTYTNKGGRDYNEDCLDYTLEGGNGTFVLADGLGGHHNGGTASAVAVETLLGALSRMDAPDPEEMRTAFLDAGAAVLRRQREPGCSDMKTTAVALAVRGDYTVWGHIGDSRLYHFSGGELVSVTRDHSVTYKKYLGGEISYPEIRGDEDRASLLGVLGNPSKCAPEVPDTPCGLREGDAFLLCSDGFWEYVWDEEMLIDLSKSAAPGEWAAHMLLRHIRRAKPAYDNLSLIAVFVEEGESD